VKFKILREVAILVLLFILPLVACPLWGQVVQKKQLMPEDYSLWGETRIDRVSPDEQWASYKVSYPSGIDTLFVRNISTNKTYSYPDGNNSLFTEKNHFVCITKRGIQIQNLKTGELETIDSVSKYIYSKTNDYLIIYRTSQMQSKELIIKNPFKETIKIIQNADHFSLSPDDQHLTYSTTNNKKQNLFLIDLLNTQTENCLIKDAKANFYDFTWQKEGKSLAFFSRSPIGSSTTLYYYILETQKLYHLNPDTHPNFPKGIDLISMPLYKLLISDDLQRIFFGIKPQNNSYIQKTDLTVEIWNANDKWIYAQQQKEGKFYQSIKIALWKPFTNICANLSTQDLPKIMLNGDQHYAILSNPMQYEPQYEMEGPRDYYLLNLDTFEKELFLKEHFGRSNSIVPSPEGKYIAYFKDNDWWIYTIKNGSHKNITKTIGVNFQAQHVQLSPDVMCESPGWNSGDYEFLIYDQYDIWAVSPKTGSFRRLTRGRESKIKFKIAPIPNIPQSKALYNGHVINTFDLNKELFLKAEGADGKTGFFKWKNTTGETKIVYQDSYIDQLYYGEKRKTIFYSQQRFDISPRICFKKNANASICFFQSNPQQENFHWGKSELIEYENSNKEKLKAVLIYPANYNSKKKYPMIVSIYELQQEELHYYTNPNHESGTGFNPTIYSAQGYFVLLPDIIHKDQNVGPSTTDCVITSTNKIVSLGLIDSSRIGLIGHSFGGYQTSFVITQTSLFATAVAGAGITDLKSFYLAVSENSGRPEMWRFQKEIWRMGKTPFEAPELYELSSPINHVENITTPLLLWTGKQDEQVDPNQSMEYYLALRRLGKKSIMLLYPNQGHNIQNSVQHADLTNRIKEWFDYYLKEDNTIKWINDGVK
jgi:predicted peptidase